LLASTIGRLYSSAFYALHDARRPLRYALIRIVVAVSLGAIAALWLPKQLGIDERWGTAGLALSAGIAGWIEFTLLRRALEAKVGPTRPAVSYFAKLWAVAALAGAIAFGVKYGAAGFLDDVAQRWQSVVEAITVLGAFGAVYLAITAAMKVPEAENLIQRLRRR
jgi:putative peptidoglycan lipid II flippase